MRFFTLPAACLAALLAPAQIVIGPSDMPSAGDIVPYTTTIAPDIDLGLTGAGVMWDFTQLVPGIPGADTMVTVASTPLLYQLYFNNAFFYPDHVASYAVRTGDIDLQLVPITNVYTYTRSDATAHRHVGFGASISGLPASVRRIPVDHEYRFPLNYNDQDTSFSAFELEVPGIGFLREEQWRYNTVDGWGTLLLPDGSSHSVLRVKSVLHRRDSVYVAQFSMGFALDQPETIEYKWLANGMDLPVLHVTTVAGVPTTVRFRHDPSTGVAEWTSGNSPLLFPNPAHGHATLYLPEGWSGELMVMDALGREVFSGIRVNGGRSVDLALDRMVPGLHWVRVHGAHGTWSGRLLVQ